MRHLGHWLHSLVFALAPIGVYALPAVQAAVMANPVLSVTVALLAGAVTHAGRSAFKS